MALNEKPTILCVDINVSVNVSVGLKSISLHRPGDMDIYLLSLGVLNSEICLNRLYTES